MLTKEENDMLTRVGPGTPMGELLRRYWQPAALSEELPPGGPPVPIRLLGEDLVLFRDEQGRPGLLAMRCSHRGADLSYGRLEDGGLRCIYHGWLYDIHSSRLEQPGGGFNTNWHVPIDDEHNWRYSIFFTRTSCATRPSRRPPTGARTGTRRSRWRRR